MENRPGTAAHQHGGAGDGPQRKGGKGMVAKINAGVSVKGAIAYQDDVDENQFHYFPSAPKLTLEDQLEAFSVTYWGIGERPYFARNPDTDEISSQVGAILSGQVIFDVANAQKRELEQKITEIYDVTAPKLVPFMLLNTEIVPVFASQVLGIASDGEATFPTVAQIGSSVAYSVGNGSGRFAQLFANVVAKGGSVGIANPDFALNIYGQIEMAADPWVVEIEADLRQVWEFTRAKFDAEARIGWFSLTASFEDVMQEMQKQDIVTIKYIEGSPDLKDPGNQLFEQGKVLFEAINAEVSAGEGLFKLEPNPTPPDPPAGGGSVLPWGVTVNASYQKSFFKQEIKRTRRLEYSGRVLRTMPSSIVLAVSCGSSTEKYFYDLMDMENPCITQSKIDGMNERLAAERKAQNKVVEAAAHDLDKGAIDNPTFDQVMAYLQNNSLTEDIEQSPSTTAVFSGPGQRRPPRSMVFHHRKARKPAEYGDVLRRIRRA